MKNHIHTKFTRTQTLLACIVSVLLVLPAIPTQLNAGPGTYPSALASLKSEETAKAAALLIRLEEIKAIDRSTLTPLENKQLRKEVRLIKRDLRAQNNGVLVSVGGLVFFIVLLVLLM